jgi:hypothetical protein
MSQRRIAACFAIIVASAVACSDSGTGPKAGPELEGSFALQTIDGTPLPIAQRKIVSTDTSGTTTYSCTDYLAAMQIVVSSGSATRGESHNLLCDDGTGFTTSTFESGKAFRTAEGWRLDFTGADLALSTHYFGRWDGTTLTIVRRETDVMISGQVLFPANTDLSQLVFKQL